MLIVNRTLKHLNITGNKIQDDGVRDIMVGLQHNYTLTKLGLGVCEISVKGRGVGSYLPLVRQIVC